MRDDFKAWLVKYAELKNNMPDIYPGLNLRLEFSVAVGEDEERSVSPPVNAIIKAMEFWKRGEHYAPNNYDELCH